MIGDDIHCMGADGLTVMEGKVLAFDPPTRLAYTWSTLWDSEMEKEPPSRVTFEIEVTGEVCRLRVTHDQFEEGSKVHEEVSAGWPAIICSLKSLLETGQALPAADGEG